MKHRILLSILLLLFLNRASFGQNNVSVLVNQFTGTPQVALPLLSLQAGQISLPIGLVYSTNGVKVKDIESAVGMGWGLSAGGQVTRELRGLPDDDNFDGAARLGWYYNNNGTKVNAFTIANTGSSGTCANENADLSYLSTNFPDLSDTEPDIFHVNAPGLSCDIVFDAAHQPKVMPYQDLKITVGTNSNGRFSYFLITTDQGVQYRFEEQEYTQIKTVAATTPSYYKRFYDQFSPGIGYFSAWKLSAVSDRLGNGFNFTYAPVPQSKYFSTPFKLAPGGSSTSALQFSTNGYYTAKCLKSIIRHIGDDIPSSIVKIYYGGNFINEAIQLSPNKIPTLTGIEGMGRQIRLLTSAPKNIGTPNKYPRAYLSEVKVNKVITDNSQGFPWTSREMIEDYKFSYAGLTEFPPDSATLAMPDSTSKKIDYWGYYNGSSATALIPQTYVNPSNTMLERYRNAAPGGSSSSFPYTLTGADRAANPLTVMNGSLTGITYMNGGSTMLEYESNSFYDPTAAAVIQGGGVRVKKITQYDGLDAAKNIVQNFTYLNPVTGLSSGKPVLLPVYAFTTPYTGGGTPANQWSNSTIRSEDDLSAGDNSIVYQFVRVSQPGSGSTLNEYSTPATNWDNSASPDWTRTTTYVARVGCGTATLATNTVNNYPFPNNINYGFERGLLKRTISYNEATPTPKQVSESVYTYTRSYNTPVTISALKFDDNTAIAKNYAKYSIFTGTSELIAQVSSRVFDLNSTSLAQTKTIAYSYASANHKLMTSQQTTGSDGSIQTNRIKYVKDYQATFNGDTANVALYELTQQNLNYPVEQYTQVTRSGTTTTVGASLTKFKGFNNSSFYAVLPAQRLSLFSEAGVTDFQVSAIAANTFTNDSRYVVRENDLIYDASGSPSTMNDNNRHTRSVLIDDRTMLPAATIINARADEVAFSDFDYRNVDNANFALDTARSTDHHSGAYGKVLSGSGITRTLHKNSQSDYYIFSAWMKGGGINLYLTNGTGTVYTYILEDTGPSGQWNYAEMKVPVGNMSATFTARIIGGLSDDVWFYPEVAEVSSTGYDPQTMQKTSETNTNGVTTYYTYDIKERLKFVYNQDRDVVMKKAYVDKGSSAGFVDPVIYYTPANYNNLTMFNDVSTSPSPFTTDGLLYTYNFGDGSPVVSTAEIHGLVGHRYTSTGPFTVSVTKTSPFYGTRSSSRTITLDDHSDVLVPVSIYENPSAINNQISTVQFFEPGSSTPYIMTRENILDGINNKIRQGIYTVKVVFSGSASGRSINYQKGYVSGGAPIVGGCSSLSGTTPVTFTNVDLNGMGSLLFSLLNTTCPPIPVNE